MNSNDTLHGGLLAASILGFIAIASVGAKPARASEQSADRSPAIQEVRVSFNREDLSDPKVAGKLYTSLRQASAKVCSASNTRSGDLESYSRWQQCYRQTLHDAITQVNAPVLLALYDSSWKSVRG
jgi:UrcA family protein